MSHILHRAANAVVPVAVSGEGVELIDARRQALHRRLRRRGGLVPRPRPSRRHRRDARQLDALAYAHTSFFTSEVAEELADAPGRGRAGGHRARLLRQRRLGGDRGGAQDGAAIFRRERRAAAPPLHRAAPELSRQHAGRARGRRQRMAARAVRAAADRDPSHRRRAIAYRACAPKRERRRPMAARSPTSSRTEIRELGPETVIAFVAETVGRRDRRRRAAGRRLFQARPRDLRPLRRAADPRRGDVRHGAHRHPARLRAGRHRARPHDDRQGPGRRLSADRRGAAQRAGSSRPSPRAPASSSTATPIWAIRWPAPPRSPCRR